MGIASWSGPLRKHVEKRVKLAEDEASTVVLSYTNSLLNKTLSKGEAISTIQSTLELCFGFGNNFRLLIVPVLSAIEKDPQNKAVLLQNLLKDCKHSLTK